VVATGAAALGFGNSSHATGFTRSLRHGSRKTLLPVTIVSLLAIGIALITAEMYIS